MTDDDSRTKLVDADPLEDPDGGFGERTLDVLLTDYAAAAEDGRYRDRFLHYTYYLAVVLVGLILSASEMLLAVADGRPFVLVLIGVVGVFTFGTLSYWAESFREARNAAWARRAEIEEYLRGVEPGVIETNRAINERLSFDSYEHEVGPA